MRVAIYTLTRDRLEFTRVAFESLREKAGWPFDHYVLDNGSEDGTKAYLRDEITAKRIRGYLDSPVNLGISLGSNHCLDVIQRTDHYDLIVKMDNDCRVVSADLLAGLVRVFADTRRWSARLVASPRVSGIARQPARIRKEGRGGFTLGVTGIVGGLFHAVPDAVYREWRYPTELPLAWGQDDAFCAWLCEQGVTIGYVEELEVEHYLTTDGQAERYPTYFERKHVEERAHFEPPSVAEPTEETPTP